MNGRMDETESRYLSGTFYLWYFRCMIHMHAQNMLPEQIFFPFMEILLLFTVNSILRSCQEDGELDALQLEPQKQGARQEPLWLVKLILVDSSACSDNEATQAAVWCGQDRREHGWSVSLVGRGVGVWEPAPRPQPRMPGLACGRSREKVSSPPPERLGHSGPF